MRTEFIRARMNFKGIKFLNLRIEPKRFKNIKRSF